MSDHQWVSLQCLLFWQICEEKNLPCFPSSTRFCFLQNNFLDDFNDEDLQNLYQNHIDGKIFVKNFLMESRQKNKDKLDENSFDGLVHNLILVYNEYSQTDFVEFLSEIILKVSHENPQIIEKEFSIPPLYFKFAIGALQSMLKYCEAIQNEIDSSKRDKSDLIHKALILMLFDNSYDIPDQKLEKFFKISNYFIDKARKHIDEFKNKNIKNFDRVFKERKVYSDLTINLIKLWWNKKTVECEGRKIAKKFISKDKSLEEPIRYIPTTIVEFYIWFCEDNDFGPKCTLNESETCQCPSLNFFLKYRPFYIRPFARFKTCYCSNCMQMDAFLKTFVKILRNHCNCKKKNCKNFTHRDKCCLELNEKGVCPECPSCFCDKCCACKVSLLDTSKTNFMKLLSCEKFQKSGRSYPHWACIENKCSSCKIKNEFDLLKLFCSNLKTMDMGATIYTKIWKDEVIHNQKRFGKKSKFTIKTLEPIPMKLEKFLKVFFDFLVCKRGYRWHHHVSHFQRYNYNKIIQNFQNGLYGENVGLFILDFSGDHFYTDGRTVSAEQYYARPALQIFGIVEMYYQKVFHGVSNFIFSDQNISKSPENCFDELKNRIVHLQKQNPKMNVFHIFSDGSTYTKEFLCKRIFYGLKEFSNSLNITLVWHYLANKHGKNICDSEFSRLKQKLYRFVLHTNKRFTNASEIYKYCFENLRAPKWFPKGDQVKSRNFKIRTKEANEVDVKLLQKVPDTKLFRCVMWDQDGNFYRKNCSCSCINCIKYPTVFNNCLDPNTLSGDFTPFNNFFSKKVQKMKDQKKKVVEKMIVEEISDTKMFDGNIIGDDPNLNSDIDVW